ncbi:hypothetical protein ASG89_25085 [Paenibacillus sp. Soil766]|uniref:helix-turn-helix domain-containing protein n=1 Tax=Paenibacillus sp. Soil766 TaxID=1736404 RepID=UPI00070B3529|nr:AraC family transcriptional regulator [Paenibacillus sp. Soil766]KRF02321.1 hypothetical protein ASG89_25085 [Paenibacillus sp. Soil766]
MERQYRYFERIIAYMEGNYMKDLSLEQLCAEVSLSTTYVNHILKSCTHRTFIHVLNEIRIKKACEYLEDDRLKVREIAEKTGFRSSKYFIKIFKDMQGVTPGQYKR